MKVEFNDHIPIFIQIKQHIQLMVINNELSPGEKMPSVRNLSQKLEVNPNTVSRAYQDLERDGFSYTKRGMGTFITEDVHIIDSVRREMSKEFCKTFVFGMKDLGFKKEEVFKVLEEYLENGGE